MFIPLSRLGGDGEGHVIYEIHHLADCLQQIDSVIFIFTIAKLFFFHIRCLSFISGVLTPPPFNPSTCHYTIFSINDSLSLSSDILKVGFRVPLWSSVCVSGVCYSSSDCDKKPPGGKLRFWMPIASCNAYREQSDSNILVLYNINNQFGSISVDWWPMSQFSVKW